MSNPLSSLNIPNEQLLLINILNTMYNDNIRQINSLTNANNEIRNTITHLLNPRRPPNNRYRNGNTSRPRDYNVNFHTHASANTGSNERVYSNNRAPYIIEEIQEYSIPYSQAHSWVNNENINLQDRTTPQQNQERSTIFTTALQRFLEPVEVFPTQVQIETATRRAMYCDIVSPINRSCPISLETFNDSDVVSVIRHCGHIFNTEHLNTWFRTNCRCPVCRYDIRNYNPSSRYSELNANNVTHSTPSIPLHEAEGNERPVNSNQSPTTRRTAALSHINSYLNGVNDTNLQEIANFGSIFSDISGNLTEEELTSPTILFTLLSRANNFNFR